ncbi:unnamed protein product [Prorocentrum cordatum]|uniref:Uncharacterized protein n=1 Tax=Prorocentrum cordatum TaxID=2364126 RepID=A0ABN9Q1V2_9DINO|nr:unnamed protein product [Polarella glacialis]
MNRLTADLGDPARDAKRDVYLVTMSRVLPGALDQTDLVDVEAMSREGVGRALLSALNGNGGGVVKKMAVFKALGRDPARAGETHADGSSHFHAAVSLFQNRRWFPVERAVREHAKMATRWSCSHSQWWSALRYCAAPTLKKPVVDGSAWPWSHDGSPIDFFEEPQRPFQAGAWKRRREEVEKSAAAGGAPPKKFSKLDLTAVILDQELKTKAAVLECIQSRGTEAMQRFVHNHQRQLGEHIAAAAEWGNARKAADLERKSDWDMVCAAADDACGNDDDECSYKVAAEAFFEVNQGSISRAELACALRASIVNGPSKTTRTPLIVGPTNTGKSTLLMPFDKLFGQSNVLHKPALGSKFALRNITKGNMRFIFWDDYRPVEYAQKTVEVATFLSLFSGHPFEVQVSQSFNDGNPDAQWNRGAAMTAKEAGLWEPKGAVSAEDVRHMQSRVQVFPARVLPKTTMRDACPCPGCMRRWIREAAAQADIDELVRLAPAALRSSPAALPLADGAGAPSGAATAAQAAAAINVNGLDELAVKAALPPEAARALRVELVELGAVGVGGLAEDDWRGLRAWGALRHFEQRRLLKSLEM